MSTEHLVQRHAQTIDVGARTSLEVSVMNL